MAIPKPGDFITTRCRRCDDVTGHVVMHIVDGVIAKVECRACGSVHKYRETAMPKAAKAQSTSVRHVRAGQAREDGKDLGRPKPTTPKAAAKTIGASATRQAAKIESAWQEAMVRHSAETPAPYSMNAELSEGLFIDHPVFGRGVVLAVARPDKAEILFQEGIKLLRCKVQ